MGMAVEEVAFAFGATGMVSGDGGGGGSVVAASTDVLDGRYACLASSDASTPPPRCLAATGCALGVVGRCVDGDMVMV